MIRILLVLSTFTLLFSSCETFIAEDLTGQVPVLILPAENDTISVNPVQFKWQEMNGATEYHLMVVSPSFSSISEYAIDSIVTGTDFFFDLDSNEYELMLVGQNNAYNSDTLGPIKFWVGTATVSSSNTVTLLAPSDNEYVNETFDGEFSWVDLSNEDNYEFEIREGTSFGGATSVIETLPNIGPGPITIAATLDEGEYHWGVTAYINSVPTAITTRRLYVDTVNPNKAILSIPSDGITVLNGTISFAWNNQTDPGTVNSPVYSFFEIADDIGFTNIIDDGDIIGGSINIDLNNAGFYYWRVSNYDEAGNLAPVSEIFTLTVQ